MDENWKKILQKSSNSIFQVHLRMGEFTVINDDILTLFTFYFFIMTTCNVRIMNILMMYSFNQFLY